MKSRHINALLSSASFGVLASVFFIAQAQAQAPVQLGPVQVGDQAAPYKAEQSSPKATAPLRDTPQSVTVVTKELIAEQNLLNLRDVLANTVPGITFTAGEGGGGYGDGINLRGYSATSDITVDGVRDSAQYTRSDPFNLEQIEITNGANSVNNGGGSVGGGINLVSKVANFRDLTVITAGGGTENYGRLTLDAERALSDTVSLRLNLMVHTNDAPGRDVEKFSRYGFAPSLGFQLSPDTRITASYLFQHDDNIPQYGVPFFDNAFFSGGLPGVPRSAYYGYANVDRQRINNHTGTVILDHQFSDTLSLRNLTRYGDVAQRTVVNPPQGTWCLPNGINPATGAACAPSDTFVKGGPAGNTRISSNQVFYNQTDLRWSGEALGVQHNAVLGAAFTSEDYRLGTGNSQRTATNGAVTYPNMSIVNPDHFYRGPINYFQASVANGERENQAIYAFDTITIVPELLLNLGVRWEHNEGRNNTDTWTNNTFTAAGPYFTNQDDLLSYRAGLVYKPVEAASIYFAYSNSKTPSQSSVNGACSAVTCNVDPEKAVSYEIGAKWDILDGLSLAAALFRNDRTNYKVPSGDPTLPDQVLDGSARVDGFSLTAVGSPLEGWNLFATYTLLDSVVLQSASNFCVANPGAAGCAAALANTGNPLTNTPKHAGNLWTTYQFLPQWTAGYGVTLQGGYYFNNGAPPLFEGGSYVTHRLMLQYDILETLGLQLNVNNLFDKTYFTRGRNNGWATPGDGRSVTLTATYRL